VAFRRKILESSVIKDLLRFFEARRVFDPCEGSGTCRDVCEELGIYCRGVDLKNGTDFCDPDPGLFRGEEMGSFDFVWMHPPYWRQKVYSNDPRDLSAAPTLEDFLRRYDQMIRNCSAMLAPGGHMAILMGDYTDRECGFVPLVYLTKQLCFRAGLRQVCTDIVRLSHGATSAHRSYRSKFIPGLHDVVTIVGQDEEADDRKQAGSERKEEVSAYLNGAGAQRD
jgi:hypothetical protein